MGSDRLGAASHMDSQVFTQPENQQQQSVGGAVVSSRLFLFLLQRWHDVKATAATSVESAAAAEDARQTRPPTSTLNTLRIKNTHKRSSRTFVSILSTSARRQSQHGSAKRTKTSRCCTQTDRQLQRATAESVIRPMAAPSSKAPSKTPNPQPGLWKFTTRCWCHPAVTQHHDDLSLAEAE